MGVRVRKNYVSHHLGIKMKAFIKCYISFNSFVNFNVKSSILSIALNLTL